MQTFVSILRQHATERPDKTVWVYHENGIDETERLTFGELDRRARSLAALMQARGLAEQRAILLFPPGLDFGVALLACMYAQVTAVPAYPPEPHRLAHTMKRLQSIIEDAAAPAVITSPMIRSFAANVIKQTKNETFARLDWLTTDEAKDTAPEAWTDPGVQPDDIAFIQYTSGSTAAPKGVVISHHGLTSNLSMAAQAYELSAESVFACWLPLYHDMGLVGNLLNAVYLGAVAALMPPYAFLKKPARWLQLASKWKATVTAAPNFAYDLTVRKVTEAERDALDLSHMLHMVNGAEPVRAETVERFLRYFAPAGLDRASHAPSYGMAEIGLFASTGSRADRPRYRTVSKAGLARHAVIDVPTTDPDAITLTGSGRSWGDADAIIVHPHSRQRLAADKVGEIWLSGSHVAQGYWGRSEVTEASFKATLADGSGPFLRTGDLGFLDDGEVFVTGRRKDLLIIRGRNLYPQDLELTLDQTRDTLPEIRPGCAVATSMDLGGEERIILFQEVEPKRNPDFDPERTLSVIRDAITRDHEIQAWAIYLLKKGTLPKTSSGKVMRQACRRAAQGGFADGGLEVLHQSTLELATPAIERTALAPNGALDADGVAASARRAESLLAWLGAWLDRTPAAALRDPHAPDVLFPFAERRLFGLLIPVEHGGLGLSVADAARVLGALARAPALAIHLAKRTALGIAPIVFAADDESLAPALGAIARGRQLVVAVKGEATPEDEGWRITATLPPCPGATWATLFAIHDGAPVSLLVELAMLTREGDTIRGRVPATARLVDASLETERLHGVLLAPIALAQARGAFAALVQAASQARLGEGWLIDDPQLLRGLDDAAHRIRAVEALLGGLDQLPAEALDLLRLAATALAWQISDQAAQVDDGPWLAHAHALRQAAPGDTRVRHRIGHALLTDPATIAASLGDLGDRLTAALAGRDAGTAADLAGRALLASAFGGAKLPMDARRSRQALLAAFDALAAVPPPKGRAPTARMMASLAARFGAKPAPRQAPTPTPVARAAAPRAPAPTAAASHDSPAVTSLKTWMIHWIAREMGMEPAHLERRFKASRRTPFTSLGLDSVTGIQFVSALEEKLGRTIPTSTLWDYDTIDTLAQHLVGGTR